MKAKDSGPGTNKRFLNKPLERAMRSLRYRKMRPLQ
jgi:hypothetical protein